MVPPVSGLTAGKRRTRNVVQPVNLPNLGASDPDSAIDTRVQRGFDDLERAVNELVDVVQGNIDLGNLD